MKRFLRIIPPNTSDGYSPCQGTRFEVGGVEVKGVQSITITACVDDIYRCKIECACIPPDVFALLTGVTFKRPSLFQRLKEFFNGDMVRDVTDLEDVGCRRFEKVRSIR